MLHRDTIQEAMKRAAKQRTFILTEYGTLVSYEDHIKEVSER